MAVDDTPWFIGVKGVEHSANVARTLAYAATGGSDGIIGPGDFKVAALSTPGDSVRIYPGAGAMINRYVSTDIKESYVVRAPTTSYLQIEPTTSTGGRSDMIIATVRDPQQHAYSDWSEDKLNTYNYFQFEVIKGCSPYATDATNLARPTIPLARIDIPPSTATITQSMIKDLRDMTHTRVDRQVKVITPGSDVNMRKGAYQNFPYGVTVALDVPPWATRLTVMTTYSGIEVVGSGTERQVAGFRGVIGNVLDTQNTILTGLPNSRQMHICTSQHAIPADYRGKTVAFACQANHSQGSQTFQVDYQSTITYDAQFMEIPE